MEAVAVSEEPLPPDDLRCKRTDGRDWRCKRPIVPGKSFCLSHLHRGQKQPPPRNSTSINNTDNSTTPPNPKPDKPRVRIRVKLKPQPPPTNPDIPTNPEITAKPDIVVKPEPVEDVVLGDGPKAVPDPVQALGVTEPVPDHLRCHRNDGRTWRCKKQAMVGQTLCEVHFNKARAQNQRKPRIRAQKKKKEEEEEEGGVIKSVGENNKIKIAEGQTSSDVKKDNAKQKANKKNKKGEIVVISGNKRKKKDVTAGGGGGGGGLELPESLRCTRNDGKLWRCKSRVVEGQNLCEPHLKRVRVRDLVKKNNNNKKKKTTTAKTKNFDNVGCNVNGNAGVVIKEEKDDDGFVVEKQNSKRVAMGKEAVPAGRGESNRGGWTEDEDAMRCKRTDGRGWRCKRRVSEGKTLCEIHYEQGRLRQMKITVPEELKIQRGEGGEKAHKSLKRKRELEILENNSDKGMKRMKAELIRVFLRREILESKKKSEKSSAVSGEVTRDLPFGLMAIPPAPPTQFIDNNAGSLGIKIGAHCSNSLVTRRFRSKNIEPLPIGPLKVVPYPGNVRKVKSSGRKKCHWCRKCEDLIRCSSCKKRYFCSNCIKERSADPEEVKLRCPACHGCCDCKACCSARSRGVAAKQVLKENCMGSKFQHLQYLINFLLPILVQINHEQSIEVEMEAKFRGQNSSDVEIRQADVGCRDQCCCHNCKSPILDFHRSCPNCSYNLCLSCCREYVQVGSLGGAFPNRIKTLFPLPKNCSEKSADLASSAPVPDSTAGIRISCPPMELGGCDNSLLDLRCIFPLNWTKELEISTKETASEFDFVQNTDDSVNCSFCARISQAGNKNKELQEASRRKESNDNLLYCPTTSVDQSCLLAHFQKHWREGQPVKVRNVLQCVSVLSWDPLAMFCGYLENGSSNGKNLKNALEDASCSGSYDVQISTSDSFSGSMEGYMHRRRETLKVKAKISSGFSRKLLEGYYSEIIHALPFQEYTNPRMGLLNIAGKLPEDFPDSKLGPHVCISYGSREEVARGELVTKLCCNSYDVVNILVHVGDAHCSTEQLNKIKKLIKRNNSLKQKGGQASNKDLEDEDTRLHSEISVEAGEQLRVAGTCCSAAANDVFAAKNFRDNKASSPVKLVNCSDTDSDASMICSRTSPSPEKSVDQIPHLDHLRSPIVTGKQPAQEPCGAQWDVFRRQDIPKLLEYIEKHVDELRFSYGLSDNIVHPIFDGSLYLDAAHKMQLKEEFEIEPWTFSQCLGEAVFIPAGCPYQIRNVKSCVNIALGFVSPENASECIKLINEIRILPNNHKAKQVKLEVEKMTICSIDEAIKEVYRLMSEGGSR